MKLRPPLVLLHRWFGLAVALFLFISGLPGRILISAMGLVVAMLSATGLVIWLRKRRARHVQTH